MKRALPIVLDTLHALALAVWLGGLAMLWLTLVPVARQTPAPGLASGSAILNSVWRGQVEWALRCGITMIGVQFLLRRRYQRNRPRYIGDGVRQLLTFGALLLALYAPRGNPFAAANGFSMLMALAVAQAALLIAVTALTAWLQMPQANVLPGSVPGTAAAEKPLQRPGTPGKKRAVK
jgi:hypothetical protein